MRINLPLSFFMKTKKKMISMMSEMTGQPPEKIQADVERDYFMSAEEALRALRALKLLSPQRRMLLVGASALSAASFTVMLGGSWLDFGVSFFCGALVQAVLPPLMKMRVPVLISSMIAGALTTLMALVSTLALADVSIEPIISGAIMPLLPGLAVTNAMRDTIRGDLVSGGARVIEAILSVMMLAAGIGLMLSMWGGIRP